MRGRFAVLHVQLKETKVSSTAVNPNKALWEKGDFTRIAAYMRESGEHIVASLGVQPAHKVLDVGCGDGTTAVPLARTGADVTGIDIARNLVEAGNRRAAQMGLANLRFQEGDAQDLAGVADGTFDLSMSIFGAMFAPRPFDVAREMVRVTKPGGRIVMGNWIPNDPTFVSQLLKVSSAFTPPPPEGFVSPMLWGVEANILERFEKAGVPAANVSMVRETYLFEGSGTPESYIDEFRQYYGPTMNAFEAAQKDGKEGELRRQLVELARTHNQSQDGISIPATFMRVTVRRP
jgi:SAM-dependent methyltransferase